MTAGVMVTSVSMVDITPVMIAGVLLHQETFIVCIGVLQKYKWEDADTIDKSSWGYQRDISIQGYHTTEDLVHLLVTVVR